MPRGTVKWFNNAKGFGFILPDDGGSDLFAHYSAIEMEGYRTLKAGQPVSFNVEDGQKGLHANNIQPLDIEASGEARSSEASANDTTEDKSTSDANEKHELEEIH